MQQPANESVQRHLLTALAAGFLFYAMLAYVKLQWQVVFNKLLSTALQASVKQQPLVKVLLVRCELTCPTHLTQCYSSSTASVYLQLYH